MAAYHKTNLGMFGDQLICDIDGYTYDTAEEWLNVANLDAATEEQLAEDDDFAQEWAEERAAAAREAIKQANDDAAEWQSENC